MHHHKKSYDIASSYFFICLNTNMYTTTCSKACQFLLSGHWKWNKSKIWPNYTLIFRPYLLSRISDLGFLLRFPQMLRQTSGLLSSNWRLKVSGSARSVASCNRWSVAESIFFFIKDCNSSFVYIIILLWIIIYIFFLNLELICLVALMSWPHCINVFPFLWFPLVVCLPVRSLVHQSTVEVSKDLDYQYNICYMKNILYTLFNTI